MVKGRDDILQPIKEGGAKKYFDISMAYDKI